MTHQISLPEMDDFDDLLPRTGDEDDDTTRGDAGKTPWDPSKIRISTKHFSLRDVVDQIREKEIDLSPDYQRDYIWKQRHRTRLVESILLGIPLPAFYFNQDLDGAYQVVDGVQRLATISLFMDDGHVLDGADLEYLQHLNGLKFSQLDKAAFRRFRSTQIVVHVIEPQTPDEVKYDIFSRVNTLGDPLSPQEIRHAMSKERSHSFLKLLSELPEFDEATGWQFWRKDPLIVGGKTRNSARMTNRELALRFCAFRSYSDEEYRTHPSLDAFLVEYTKRLDGISDRQPPVSPIEIDILGADFRRAMSNAYQVMGKAAFRRWPLNETRRGPLNRAVFESQAIALADYSLDSLLPRKDEIQTELRKAFEEPEYARSVTLATGHPKAVETRILRTKSILARVMQ